MNFFFQTTDSRKKIIFLKTKPYFQLRYELITIKWDIAWVVQTFLAHSLRFCFLRFFKFSKKGSENRKCTERIPRTFK